jgi:hypothetical protein
MERQDFLSNDCHAGGGRKAKSSPATGDIQDLNGQLARWHEDLFANSATKHQHDDDSGTDAGEESAGARLRAAALEGRCNGCAEEAARCAGLPQPASLGRVRQKTPLEAGVPLTRAVKSTGESFCLLEPVSVSKQALRRRSGSRASVSASLTIESGYARTSQLPAAAAVGTAIALGCGGPGGRRPTVSPTLGAHSRTYAGLARPERRTASRGGSTRLSSSLQDVPPSTLWNSWPNTADAVGLCTSGERMCQRSC